VIVGLVGISIIVIAIITVNVTSVKMTQYNIHNDQAFQIGRSVMEDIKNKLLNYSNTQDGIKLVYNSSSSGENVSSLCLTESDYTCASANPEVNLVELASIGASTCPSSNQSVSFNIAMSNAAQQPFTVKIESLVISTTDAITYDDSKSPLTLCKYVRKFRVTVSPPNNQKPVSIEAFYPIPT
jgi:hypothetical protein